MIRPRWPEPAAGAITAAAGGDAVVRGDAVVPRDGGATGDVVVAAIDLGASSGRVVLGRVGPGSLELTEVHRFPNVPVRAGGTLHWDILALYRGVLDGLRAAVRTADEAGWGRPGSGETAGNPAPGDRAAGKPAPGDRAAGEPARGDRAAGDPAAGQPTAGRPGPAGLRSVGIDSWAVDYGLLDADGRLLGNPVHYRDGRTADAPATALARVPAPELYARTGLQFQPFNTVFQLVAAEHDAQLAVARTLLLIPDLVGYWLTGAVGAERTNASTTGLLDARGGDWADDLIARLGIRRSLLPAMRGPGDPLGAPLPQVREATGLSPDARVIAVGSHDTASAVVAVPAQHRFAYVSCGTWSLVGVELDAPVLTEDARAANFTNEVGVDGTFRFLRNVMGLWLLQESMRAWAMTDADLDGLLRAAARVAGAAPSAGPGAGPDWGSGPGAGPGVVVDANGPEFLPPGDAPGESPMPARIAAACRRSGQRVPDGPAETVRCILDSLALAHRRAIADAQRLSGRAVGVVHLIGGGARNALLCQLTADACGLPVIAGPVEAAAIGNVLVQARALGAAPAGLTRLRELVRHTQPMIRYDPRGDAERWDAAETLLASRLTQSGHGSGSGTAPGSATGNPMTRRP